MKDLSCFFRISAFAFIASLSFSLVACDDSSSAGDEDVPVSSAIPESSSSAEDPYYEGIHNQGNPACHDSVAIDSSVLLPFCSCDESLLSDGMYIRRYKTLTTPFEPNKDCDLSVYYHCEGGRWHLVDKEDIPADSAIYSAPLELVFYNTNFFELKKCTAEREGTVDNVFDGGYYRYYRCEQGSWKEIDPPKSEQLVCDTAGVTEGAICRKTVQAGMWKYPHDEIVTYIYDGNGIWYEYEIPHLEVYCGDDDGKKGLKTYGNETGSYTEYYTCLNGELLRLSELEYYCSEESDTCSYELNGKTQYSLRKDSSWVKCDYDSTVGYCCSDDDFYREAGEKYYYCGKGTWVQPELVPHQYTDPRKDSLTDAEYDVLDLPKDASVGDLVAGLLEDCYYEPLSPKGGVYWHYELDVSEYCVPRNYYAYRVNGTWIRSSVPSGYRACKPEIEGEEMWNRESTLEYTYFKIYKCESYEWTLVGNNFSRSKKK